MWPPLGREDVTDRFLGGLRLKYTPLEWLDVEGNFSYDGSSGTFSQFRDKGYRATSAAFAAQLTNSPGAIFTGASVALSLTPFGGPSGAMWLIIWRIVQGIGGALLMANSMAILTDAFPVNERGLAMGISMIAATAGSFIGLVVGDIHRGACRRDVDDGEPPHPRRRVH